MSHRDKIARMEDYNEDDWQPPNEADLKILQAKRERQDKISKIMGDYLLKGYTMLGSVCQECDTILLRDKSGKNYCIACSELDTDISKDDPALNREAARRQAQEQEQRGTVASSSDVAHLAEDFEDAPVLRDMAVGCSTAAGINEPPAHPPRLTQRLHMHGLSQTRDTFMANASVGTGTFSCDLTSPVYQVECAMSNIRVKDSISAVQDKMKWATGELEKTTVVENSISLCNLIKSCADALESLRRIEPK